MTNRHAERSSVRLRTFPRIKPPAWLPAGAWPFETFGIESGDSLLAVSEFGEGPVLLFVHAGGWSFIWRDLVLRLGAQFRCIFFDAPGNGQTQDRSARPVTLEDEKRAVTRVIAALELDEFTLVAHDLGGPPALAAVGETPELVRGIVAMNTFGWRPSGAGFRGMLALMGGGPIRTLNVQTGFIPRISSRSFGVGRHMDPVSRHAFYAGMRARVNSFHDYMRDARRADDLYEQVDRALQGPLAKVPLLSIFGERNDPFGFQQRWKELYPSARQAVVAKGNHFPMCDAPDFVAFTIRSWYSECVAQPDRQRVIEG